MKKTLLAIVAILAVFTSTATPATANDVVDKIAIIDSYFDPSIAGTHICVADKGCNIKPSNTTAPVFSHGSRMAAIVKKYNPNAQLVLIRSGSVVGTTLYDANGREISNAFIAVPLDADVVSISIYSNGNGTNNGTGCRPSTQTRTGTVAVSTELARATNATNAIIASGRSIVGAAGNAKLPTGLNYPACLPAVTSVTIPGATGTSNPTTDIFLQTNGNYLGGDINTTSGATAFVASKWDNYKLVVVPNKTTLVGVLQ